MIDEVYVRTILLPRLPRLNALAFFFHSYLFLPKIHSIVAIPEKEEWPSKRSPNVRAISYVDYFPEEAQVQQHFYSSSFLSQHFSGVSNRFPAGRFNHIRKVSLYDEKPFEHHFFVRLERSFPLMEQLIVVNRKAQHDRAPLDQLARDDQKTCPIQYSSLRFLDLVKCHDHYLEQFLLHSKANFHSQFTLRTTYPSLERVTDTWTSNEMRINAEKVTKLRFYNHYEHSHSLEEYFPHAKISVCFLL